MTNFMNNDGSGLVGGLNPSGIGQALRVDAAGNLLVAASVQAGYTTAYSGNAGNTSAGVDYPYKWGLTGASTINHLMMQNNTSANVQWELDATATAGSPILAPGDTLFFDIPVTTLHLLTAANQPINGTSGSNIVIRAWS